MELNQGCNLFSVMGKVTVCCGASGLAGEMLDIVHTGMSVILADHSNTERDFLHRAKGKNKWLCEEGVFKLDRDPLKII